jgi:hypothetical protein
LMGRWGEDVCQVNRQWAGEDWTGWLSHVQKWVLVLVRYNLWILLVESWFSFGFQLVICQLMKFHASQIIVPTVLSSECEANHSPSSYTKICNVWRFTSIPCIILHSVMLWHLWSVYWTSVLCVLIKRRLHVPHRIYFVTLNQLSELYGFKADASCGNMP